MDALLKVYIAGQNPTLIIARWILTRTMDTLLTFYIPGQNPTWVRIPRNRPLPEWEIFCTLFRHAQVHADLRSAHHLQGQAGRAVPRTPNERASRRQWHTLGVSAQNLRVGAPNSQCRDRYSRRRHCGWPGWARGVGSQHPEQSAFFIRGPSHYHGVGPAHLWRRNYHFSKWVAESADRTGSSRFNEDPTRTSQSSGAWQHLG